MFENKILKKKDLFYREFKAEDGRNLIIIEPGYIVNDQAFSIWYMMDDNISFENLLISVLNKYPNMDKNKVNNILTNLLSSFKKRELIELINDSEYYLGTIEEKLNSEINLLQNYSTTIITQIDLVLTTGCNFRCRHCFLKDSSYKNSDQLDISKWKELIDKLCRYGLISVIITGGEPLIYKQLPELLDYIDGIGLKIQLLTNGYLLSEDFISHISKYRNIAVQVSLDGSKSETNNFQRNVSDAFEKTVKNIALLRKYNISVTIAMVLNKKNVKDLYDESMFHLCEDLNVNVLGITPTVINTENALKNNDDFLETEQVIDIIQYINNYIHTNNSKFIISISAPPALTKDTSISDIKKKRPRCRRGTNSFSIRPNGSICVCSDFIELGYKEYELGNALDDDLTLILQNLNKIHKDKISNMDHIKGVCSVCTELENCGGACRADAYANYKDINAPYSLCQKLFEKGIFPKSKIRNNSVYKEF